MRNSRLKDPRNLSGVAHHEHGRVWIWNQVQASPPYHTIAGLSPLEVHSLPWDHLRLISISGLVSLVGWACGVGSGCTVALGFLAGGVYPGTGTAKA